MTLEEILELKSAHQKEKLEQRLKDSSRRIKQEYINSCAQLISQQTTLNILAGLV